MADSTYYVAGAALVGLVLLGINRMSKVATARRGNFLSMLAMALIVAVALVRTGEVGSIPVWACIAATLVVSLIVGARVKMIAMPQAVAILNGLGGLASALAAWVEIGRGGSRFSVISSALAIAVGLVTLSGSLVAAGKLARWFPQRSVRVPLHTPLSLVLVLAIAAFAALANPLWVALASIAFGILFSVRVGGADMPITISLLNSLSGVAAGIAGIAIGDAVLISVGGIVGASGLLLTQIMCRAMNRSLMHILLGSTSARAAEPAPEERPAPEAREGPPVRARTRILTAIPTALTGLSSAPTAAMALPARLVPPARGTGARAAPEEVEGEALGVTSSPTPTEVTAPPEAWEAKGAGSCGSTPGVSTTGGRSTPTEALVDAAEMLPTPMATAEPSTTPMAPPMTSPAAVEAEEPEAAEVKAAWWRFSPSMCCRPVRSMPMEEPEALAEAAAWGARNRSGIPCTTAAPARRARAVTGAQSARRAATAGGESAPRALAAATGGRANQGGLD